MSTSTDPRLIVGNRVQTKAKFVTSDSKCRRLYGAAWKTKMVLGTVLKVVKDRVKGRMTTSVFAKWELVSETKIVSLRLVNVKPVLDSEEPITSVTPMPNTSQETTNPIEDREAPEARLVKQGSQSLDVTMSTRPRDTAHLNGPVINSHGNNWVQSNVTLELNGYIKCRHWKVIGPVDEIASSGHGPSNMSAYDYFMWMFPLDYLSFIVHHTNKKLDDQGITITSRGEILRYFGVLVLITSFEFGHRRELWSVQAHSEYLPSPMFGKIMSRQRFEDLRRNITFSVPTDKCDRWGLIRDFINAINKHRASQVVPCERICVDESMSRWYGLGGDWIDVGLPHYVAMDRKPENGCELKTSSCGESGTLLRVEVVASAEEMSQREFESSHQHGTAVMLRLVEPWFQTDRIVCADSFFASVHAADSMYDKGLRFTGVIKTSTKGYPLQHLSHLEVSGKGDHVSMVCKSRNGPDLMAVMWVDRDRRYFFSSSGTTNPGTPIFRERWRPDNQGSKKEEISIDIPKVCETYYDTCSEIDRHNRCRQDDLGLEKKFEVKDWSSRVNTSLLAFCIVDAWKLYVGYRGKRDRISPNQFYCQLADGLIDNDLDKMTLRQRESDSEIQSECLSSGSGVADGTHLTPTKRKRKTRDGTVTSATYQGRCDICKGIRKSKFICSACRDYLQKEVFLCHHETGRDCFMKHVSMSHDLSYNGSFY